MKKIEIRTYCKKLLSDIYTPVGIYLRLRDRFRDTVLLESADYHAAENSYSFICINAIAGMEITDTKSIEFKLPGQKPERVPLSSGATYFNTGTWASDDISHAFTHLMVVGDENGAPQAELRQWRDGTSAPFATDKAKRG